MVEYCPKCGAQLPPGLEKCPNCGQRLRKKDKDEYSLGDILRLSCTTLAIILVPLLILVGIAWLIISHLK
jgi:ribosomal protein L40E